VIARWRTPAADEGDRPVGQHGDAVLEARQRDQVSEITQSM
jgi:hypothetical protein